MARLSRTGEVQTAQLIETQPSQFSPQEAEVQVRIWRARRRLEGGRGLWPRLKRTLLLAHVAVGQRFHEVVVQGATMRTRSHMAVVTEEIETLVRMEHGLVTRVALQQGKGFIEYTILL